MHFSIPDTEEFSDNGGSMYMASIKPSRWNGTTIWTGYNIHINGTFHCSVRYRQLLSLHEQLRKELGPSAASNLPPFPPKRLLPLSPSQLEERRAVLEKYIQTVSQDARVASSELFMGFLLSAQVETSKEPSSPVTLDVYLMNDKRITVDINATAPSHQVLMSVCQKLHLPPELLDYFALFLVRREVDGDITVIKKLQNFESPYISLKYMENPHRVVLRKGFWDTGLESALLEDSVALNLLYTQAVADLELGWMLADMETQELLTNLQVQGEKSEVSSKSSDIFSICKT
ncbi:hypothetical protein B566_EDAN003506 [Ephemera danica]|nr:hypothetical protein B566_EDAN003506 [Ephemera danica]